MGNVFNNIIKSIFGNKSNDNVSRKNDNRDNDDNNHYSDIDLTEKKEVVYLESAYQNQTYVFRRATESNRLILGALIKQILKLN
jgi:hypothetical protein